MLKILIAGNDMLSYFFNISRRREYEVEYVEIKNNEKPFEEFVLSLNTKERAKMLRKIYNDRRVL